MSTENKIIIGGGIMPSTPDTPGDVRERVETFAEIANIDNPSRGMKVYVADEDKEYRIKKLVTKVVGGIEIPNGAIDLEDPEAVVDVKKEIKDETMEEVNETVAVVKEEIKAETMEQVNTTIEEAKKDIVEEAAATAAESVKKEMKVEGDTLYLG